MLADPKVLSGLGFNQREIDFLAREPWWKLPALYHAPYLDAFKDEYRPFDAGLDHLDQMTPNDLLKKDGASAAAIRFIGDAHSSALHVIWHAALLKLRGVPLFPTEVFRLKGGNQTLPDTFTKRLGERVRLGCPVTGIERGDSGVRVRYREAGKEKTLEADWLVSAMSLVKLREVPVTPAWPEARQYVVKGFPYYTASRPVFQSRTPLLGEGQGQRERPAGRERPRALLGHRRRRPHLTRPAREHRGGDDQRGRLPRRVSQVLHRAPPRTSSRPSSSTGHATPGPWPASR